ncbi:hypothetical protein DL89DRAFT_266221, partial [Linderina pennispora]
MNQVATYVDTELMTAYKNNIVLHYGTCLQRILAKLIDIRSRKTTLHSTMGNVSKAEFNNACQVCIYIPAQKRRHSGMFPTRGPTRDRRTQLRSAMAFSAVQASHV